MMWAPKPEWKGEDAFIIGGGYSLHGFDFSVLRGRHTIGCNDAFRLGPEVVEMCLFGDPSFWDRSKEELKQFKGKVVTCAPALLTLPLPWLLQMRRIRDGLHEGNILGWNYSTGAAAVNLAITLGASRIFLLGFDMSIRPDGRSHWHDRREKAPRIEAYRRFMRGFANVRNSLNRYPAVRVYNVTDGSSQLPGFDRMSFPVFHSVLNEHHS